MSLPHLTSSYPAPPPTTSSSTTGMTSPPSAIPSPGAVSTPRTTCCEGGRPVMTDPHTGTSICSCQYSPSLLSYPRVASLTSSLADPRTLGESVYSSPYSQSGYSSLTGVDPAAFYSPLTPAYGYKDTSTEAWRGLTQPAAYYPYDPTMSAYPYSNSYGGMDLNGARRKNATRESTSTLKAWLNEHRKNPYPTKGEKIMLAIITKMTLTQVSTWFANARRRLKKENKMTWSPRNKCEDDKGDSDDGGEDGDEKAEGGKSDSDDESGKSTDPPHCMKQKSSGYEDCLPQTCTIKEGPTSPLDDASPYSAVRGLDDGSKPRIWSLADTATSGSPALTGRRSPSQLLVKNEDSPDSMSPSLDQFSRTMSNYQSAYGSYSPTGSRYMDLNTRNMYSMSMGLGLQNTQQMQSMSSPMMPLNNNNNNTSGQGLGKGGYMSLGMQGYQQTRYSPNQSMANGFTNLDKDDKSSLLMPLKGDDLAESDLTSDPITAFKPVMKI